MVEVRVEGRGEGRSFVDQPHPRMPPTVDPPLVPFRLAKPTLLENPEQLSQVGADT